MRAGCFRPPYGFCSEVTVAACEHLGLRPVYWSGWGMDWEPIPAERIADLVLRDLADGSVVVLHDSARYAYRESAMPTAEAHPAILQAAADRGLVPEILPAGGPPKRPRRP